MSESTNGMRVRIDHLEEDLREFKADMKELKDRSDRLLFTVMGGCVTIIVTIIIARIV